MRVIFIAFLFGLSLSHQLKAQDIPGCMDPASPDFDPTATVSDGSCGYPAGSVSLPDSRIATLPVSLKEISGMVYWNGKLYGHDDSGNAPVIYETDASTGVILKTITLEVPLANMDWEDITQDENYFYIGDFGNNLGVRTNLRIFRVAKSIIDATPSSGTVVAANIETINFSYNDQIDFTPDNDGSPFDCEAMIYQQGNLHLFTKGWDGNGTRHYILPATPGTHSATYLETLATGTVRITSSTKVNENAVVLLGYEVSGYPKAALWVVSGFNNFNTLFSSGNKRKVDLGYIVDIGTGDGAGQIEGIAAISQTSVLISSEYFSRTIEFLGTFTVPQSLYDLDITSWMPLYILPIDITNFTSRLSNNTVILIWEYYLQDIAYFEVEAADRINGVFSTIGKVYREPGSKSDFSFTDNKALISNQRFYRIKMVSPDARFSYSKTLSVTDSSKKRFTLSVAPNPFSDKLNISFYSEKAQTVQFTVTDVQGRTLLRNQLQCTPGRYSYLMDGLHTLSRGIYFLKATVSGNEYIQKIVR